MLKTKTEVKIGSRKIGNGHPVYIIAEIGLNHQGDMKLAKKLIDIAIKAKVDAVKFQKRSIKKVYTKESLEHTSDQENAITYTLNHIKNTELSDKDMADLVAYTKGKGVDFLCTPWDEESLMLLHSLDLPAFKIASADMFNLKLLSKAAALKKPLIISTGMSFLSEIEQMVEFLKKQNVEYILLHCNSTYPASYHDINLNFIEVLRDKFSPVVGYSGHEMGISASLAAVAKGAKVIERHLTLDRTMSGPDHKASLEPKEFEDLVREIRIVESALGDNIRFPTRGEYLNRETLAKSIVAAHDLKKGRALSYDDLDVKSPGKGTNPMKLDLFVGKKITRDIKKDDFILESDINLRPVKLYKDIKTNHKWGVVARMGDIETLLPCKSSFIEIHLTGSDINTNKSYTKKYNVPVSFHGPEYNGDLLLDLSSLNKDTRQKSVEFFNKALAYARKLKKNFKNAKEDAKFVVHPGGMNMERALLDKIPELNKNFADSLSKLDGKGFELLVENMPGLPWCFGGQWYHSNFMNSDEIVEFSRKYGYGVVFDTSHAALYCNYYGKSFEEFTDTILPYTKYLHVSDAAKLNGEGLQIGDGSIDFKRFLSKIAKTDLWVLPEIWQGHKFGGEGFVKAVKILKDINPEF
ncbi:MAG: N-acetylneuraminate synthase family protein [Patescibacteria group bacterium]